MKPILLAAVAVSLIGGTAALAQAQTYSGSELAGQAHITIDQARTIALKAHPGKITDQELEKENGGLRYSFDLKSGGKTFEVGVDALTGRVLENKAEGPHPD